MKKIGFLWLALAAALIMNYTGCKTSTNSHTHVYKTNITKEPTCTEKGEKTFTCDCGKTYTEEIDALSHDYEAVERTSPTCTETGISEITCKRCGFVSESNVIPAKGHNVENFISNNDATIYQDGTKTGSCSVCGEKVTVVDEGSKLSVPKGFVEVPGKVIKGNETWTPASLVFVSGRKITIPDLIVCEHEVTIKEYKAIMGSIQDSSQMAATNGKADNNPVNYVNWYMAVAYCNKLSINEGLTPCYKLNGYTDPKNWGSIPTSSNTTWNGITCNFKANGYRLPTEAEWEYLARGGNDKTTYAGSNTLSEVAWYNTTTTYEVGLKKANGFGLKDMSGNVLEWCWDWTVNANELPYNTPETGTTSSASDRVNRGGYYSITQESGFAVGYRRGGSQPYWRGKGCGFRVVRTSVK